LHGDGRGPEGEATSFGRRCRLSRDVDRAGDWQVNEMTIRVRLESGELRDYRIYDHRAPRIETVYMIKRYPDGALRAFNRAYEVIGTVDMSDDEFNGLISLLAQTCPGYTPPDGVAGDAYWSEMDDSARERLVK
jgi:hypothetical protein